MVAVEHDLHPGQALVAIVLGLVAHPAGFPRWRSSRIGWATRLAWRDDVGAGDHPFGLCPHLVHEGLGLPIRLGHELLAPLSGATGVAQLGREPVHGQAWSR